MHDKIICNLSEIWIWLVTSNLYWLNLEILCHIHLSCHFIIVCDFTHPLEDGSLIGEKKIAILRCKCLLARLIVIKLSIFIKFKREEFVFPGISLLKVNFYRILYSVPPQESIGAFFSQENSQDEVVKLIFFVESHMWKYSHNHEGELLGLFVS